MSAHIHKQELTGGASGVPGTLLDIHEQHGGLYAWYLADGSWTDVEVVPTGGAPSPGVRYFGTAHGVAGSLVFHVFVR